MTEIYDPKLRKDVDDIYATADDEADRLRNLKQAFDQQNADNIPAPGAPKYLKFRGTETVDLFGSVDMPESDAGDELQV